MDPIQDNIPLKNARNARKAMRFAAILATNAIAVDAPLAAASITFLSVLERMGKKKERMAFSDIAGELFFSVDIFLCAVKCNSMVFMNEEKLFGSLVRLGGFLVSEVYAMFTICKRESAG